MVFCNAETSPHSMSKRVAILKISDVIFDVNLYAKNNASKFEMTLTLVINRFVSDREMSCCLFSSECLGLVCDCGTFWSWSSEMIIYEYKKIDR